MSTIQTFGNLAPATDVSLGTHQIERTKLKLVSGWLLVELERVELKPPGQGKRNQLVGDRWVQAFVWAV